MDGSSGLFQEVNFQSRPFLKFLPNFIPCKRVSDGWIVTNQENQLYGKFRRLFTDFLDDSFPPRLVHGELLLALLLYFILALLKKVVEFYDCLNNHVPQVF